MPRRNPKLEAVALRLTAERVERGETLGPEFAEALSCEVERHPEDAKEIEAFAAVQSDEVPAWHLEILEERDKEEDGETWNVVKSRVLDKYKQRRSA